MPKNKTHSGASKRFKVTGSGKLQREKAGKRHNLEKKPSKVTRRMTGTRTSPRPTSPRQETARPLRATPGRAEEVRAARRSDRRRALARDPHHT